MKERTAIVKPTTGGWEGDDELFDLCIDDSKGNGLPHHHDAGHDFPMTREELARLGEQIQDALRLPL